MFTRTSRLQRAIRAGIPILGAAVILGSGALAWSAFSASRQSQDPLVVGIGDSNNTRAIAPLDEETRVDGHKVFQQHAGSHFPDWIKRVEVPKRGGTVTHVLANEPATLVYLAVRRRQV